MEELKITKNAQLIQDSLQGLGIGNRVFELPESTRTAIEAAKSIGCSVSQIVKSLIFIVEDTQKPVLVLASGPNRVDEQLIAKKLGSSIVKADAKYVKTTTGFAIGGVPPIGHKFPIEIIFIDAELISKESLWAAAGTPFAVFNISGNDLIRITKGSIVEF